MPNLDTQHLMLIQLDIAHDLLQAHDDCMSKRNLRTDSSMSYIARHSTASLGPVADFPLLRAES